MRETPVCTAADAIYKLAAGNLKYLNAENGSGDISRRIRMSTWAKGQSPYAIIVTCSDSRVIPENIFSAGIGELFVIRLAGNIIDDHQLGSIEYAAGHLGCRLVVVLGHTHCGAVDAAINSESSGYYPLHHGRDQEGHRGRNRPLQGQLSQCPAQCAGDRKEPVHP